MSHIVSAQLQVERPTSKGSVDLDISTAEVTDRAYRCCPTGAAACHFAGVETGEVIIDGSLPVDLLCEAGCGVTPARLQAGLDRLSANAKPVVTPTS